MLRFVITLATIFFASCMNGKADKAARKTYTFPAPEQHLYSSDTMLISDRLHIIGWSRDGKLAYVNEPGDEACGCYFMDLYVLDATQNMAVYHFHYSGDEENSTIKANDLASLWKQQKKIFTDTLNHYGIIPGNYIFTPKETAQTGKGELRASVSKTVMLNKDRNMNTVPEYRVLLHGRASVMPLYSSAPEEKTSLLLDIYPAAVITEPSANYAAIVTASQYYGWEGPPNTLRYQVYACRLK